MSAARVMVEQLPMPLTVSIEDACVRLGCARGKIYQLLGAGELEAPIEQLGKKGRITTASLLAREKRMVSGAAANDLPKHARRLKSQSADYQNRKPKE